MVGWNCWSDSHSCLKVRFDVSDQETAEIPDETEASAVAEDETDESKQPESESQEIQPMDLVETEQNNATVHRQRQVTKLLQSQAPSNVKDIEDRLGHKSKKSMPSEGSVANWLKLT